MPETAAFCRPAACIQNTKLAHPSQLRCDPQIHHAHALLLVLGSPVYLTEKMSSSVVSSLTTGVPVIADDAVLGAYTFLNRGAVFRMAPGEDEADVMLRVRRGRA